LDPDKPIEELANTLDLLNLMNPPTDHWADYMAQLAKAKTFHEKLSNYAHPKTFCFRGTGQVTADVIEYQKNSGPRPPVKDPYQTRGFVGIFRDYEGLNWAVLQAAKGTGGDGTVPCSSAGPKALHITDKPPVPDHGEFPIEHQPAYEDSEAQKYTIQAILALCKCRYEEGRRNQA